MHPCSPLTTSNLSDVLIHVHAPWLQESISDSGKEALYLEVSPENSLMLKPHSVQAWNEVGCFLWTGGAPTCISFIQKVCYRGCSAFNEHLFRQKVAERCYTFAVRILLTREKSVFV